MLRAVDCIFPVCLACLSPKSLACLFILNEGCLFSDHKQGLSFIVNLRLLNGFDGGIQQIGKQCAPQKLQNEEFQTAAVESWFLKTSKSHQYLISFLRLYWNCHFAFYLRICTGAGFRKCILVRELLRQLVIS